MAQYIIVMKIGYCMEKLNLSESLSAMKVQMLKVYERHLKRRLMIIWNYVKRKVKIRKCSSKEALMFKQDLICIEEPCSLQNLMG